jgi:hypothetical protein
MSIEPFSCMAEELTACRSSALPLPFAQESAKCEFAHVFVTIGHDAAAMARSSLRPKPLHPSVHARGEARFARHSGGRLAQAG